MKLGPAHTGGAQGVEAQTEGDNIGGGGGGEGEGEKGGGGGVWLGLGHLIHP